MLHNKNLYLKPVNETISFNAEIYLDDLRFYNVILIVICETCSYALSMYLLTKMYNFFKKKINISFFLIWKTVTLSNCCLFLTLPALIWDINVYDTHFYFIFIYSTLFQLINYRGNYIFSMGSKLMINFLQISALSNSNKLWCILVIFLSNFIKQNVIILCP